MSRLFQAILAVIAAQVFLLASAANVTMTPDEFLEDIPGDALTLNSNDELSLANVNLNDIVQCSGHIGGVMPGDILYIYGFARLSNAEYRVLGEQAVELAMQRARLNAQGQAARYFGAVVMTSTSRSSTDSSTTMSGAMAESAVGEILQTNLSTSMNTRLSLVDEDYVRVALTGGQVVGHQLIVRPNGDACVGARYEVPLDQSGSGVVQPRPEPTPVHVPGHEPLPPGSGTSGRF